ncbi:MAG: hypothetical protein LBP65_01655 [Puniceicoccales bacterium]|nr:hypothetical protein [Puniceicoccales bacterium]
MSRIATLFFHEWRQQALAPALLAVGSLFLILQACLFLLVLQFFNQEPQFLRPICLWMKTFWLGTLLLVPLLTMRSIAEERMLGTLDSLLSIPVPPATVVGCKFFACLAHTLTLWTIALILPWLAQGNLALPFPFATGQELFHNFLFLALTQALYVAVGIFWSTVAAQPILAGTATFLSLLLLLLAPRAICQAAAFANHAGLRHFLGRQEIFTVLAEFQWGIFDCRTLLCYGGATLFLLSCSMLLLRRF